MLTKSQGIWFQRKDDICSTIKSVEWRKSKIYISLAIENVPKAWVLGSCLDIYNIKYHNLSVDWMCTVVALLKLNDLIVMNDNLPAANLQHNDHLFGIVLQKHRLLLLYSEEKMHVVY